MFDINEELDKIIYKYKLDEYYPDYKKASNCERVLKKYIDRHCVNKENVLFLCNDQLEVDIISHIAQGDVLIECIMYKNINGDIRWEKYKEVYINSYEKYKEIREFLKQIQVESIWVYDIFEKNGCGCDREFYKLHMEDYGKKYEYCFPGKEGWRNVVQLELYNCQKRYREIKDEKAREQEKKKILFLLLYMRNFREVSSYFEELSKKEIRYKDAYNEVRILLEEIKKRIKGNRDKNIVLYWMDAISYEECEDMMYLQKQMKKCVVFENAFTSTPHTFATSKNMFLGKYLIDDRNYGIKKIHVEDSEVLTFLEAQGYEIKSISGYMGWFGYNYRSSKRHELYEPCSAILWDLMSNVINQKNKTFYIVHMLVEGHNPYLNSRMSKKSLLDKKIRSVQGRKELDGQLEFYDKILNDECCRIYMSDHGKKEFTSKYHIVLSVYNRNIKNKIIKEMFSIVDFSKLIKQILEKNCINENELKREYVKIQDLDWYNPKLIRKMLMEKTMPDLFLIGYKGIITHDKMYIKFRTGQEWLADRNYVKHEPIIWNECDCSDDDIELLRSYAGEYPEEIANDELFKYSKYVYSLLKKYDLYMKEYINVICTELDKYPMKSIAIRMGGEHSMQLFSRMSDEHKEKIACFVDNSKSCLCSKYGLPIIDLDELENRGIHAIILSSYDYREMLRRESKKYPKNLDIIDIYSIFEKKGIYCTKNFYMDIKLKDEDYDVGFPFEEFE